MRPSLALLVITAWVAAPIVRGQTAASQTVPTQPVASQPASRQSRPHRATTAAAATPKRRAAADKAGGVLALGATDITGNKELPKVMVIVPWKDSLGASGVIKPTDSLLDQVLQPVDRGVFQREIHYYGQLQAGEAAAGGKVAPGGDSH